MKKRIIVFMLAVCLIVGVSALTACNGGEKDYASCALNGTWLEGIDSVEFTDGDGGVYGVIDKRNFRIPDLPKDLLVIRINLSGEDSVKNLQFYIDGSEYALSELKYIEGTSLPYYEITYRVTDDFVISFVGTTSSNEGELTVEVWPEEFVQGNTITVQEGTVDAFNIMVRLSSGHYADITQVVSLVSDNPDVIEVMPDPYDMSDNFAAYSAFVRSVGTAHVTISTSKQTKTLTFVVTELPPAQVSKLELNRSTMQLYNGWQNYDTYVTAKLDCSEFDARRTVKVSVDNPSVITLGETSFSNNNDGESTGSTAYISVTPAKVGSAKISITALGLTATCDVTVVAKPEEVEGSQGLQIEKRYISGYGTGDGVYCVTGLGTCSDSSIEIPNVYNGERVIGVEALYSSVDFSEAQMGESTRLNNISSITVPEGVEILNAGAFKYLVKLQSVTLPSGLRKIGREAFYNCFELTELELPETVEAIDAEAFHGAGITSLTIPGSVQSIASESFFWSSLTSVTLNEGITSVGASAFRHCQELTKVNLPKSLTEIGEMAFYECNKLAEIELPDGLKTIGGSAFANCESLSELALPESVESLGETVLSYAPITEFEWPTKVTEIPKNFFAHCNKLRSVTIPEGVTKIGEGAFSYCNSLSNVTLPSSVKNIEKDAFSYCTYAFNEIHLSSGVTYGINAFSGVEVKKIYAADLTTLASGWVIFNFDSYGNSDYEVFLGENDTLLSGAITISAAVKTVPYEFLIGYDGITSVTIEAEEIGEGAFSYCSDLTTVVLKNTKKINNSAFYYCPELADVTLPDDLEFFGGNCFDKGYGNFNDINLRMGSWLGYCNLGKVMQGYYTMEKLSGRKLYIGGELIQGEVTIPSDAKAIPSYAFYYDNGITKVVLENGVEEIGEHAFFGCEHLQKITLPSSLKTVDPEAIGYCVELTEIECPDTLDVSALLLNNCDKFEGTLSADGNYHIFSGRIRSLKAGLTYFVAPQGVKFAADALKSVGETLKFIYADDLSVLQDVNFDDCTALQAIIGKEGELSTSKTVIRKVNSSCTSDGWVYEKESGSLSRLTLLCFIGEPDQDGNLTVPTSIDGSSVTNLSFLDSGDGHGCFFGNTNIKKITFEKDITVTSVSFLNLTSLKEIVLKCSRWIVMPANNLAQVKTTFDTCTSLTTISIPDKYIFSVSYQNTSVGGTTILPGENILEILKTAPQVYLFIVDIDAPGTPIDTVVGNTFEFKTARISGVATGIPMDEVINGYQGTTLTFNSDSSSGTMAGGQISQSGGAANFTYTYEANNKTGSITLSAGDKSQTMTFKVENDKLILSMSAAGASGIAIELIYVMK